MTEKDMEIMDVNEKDATEYEKQMHKAGTDKRRNEIKHTVNKLTFGVFFYELIMYAVVIGDMLIKCIHLFVVSGTDQNVDSQIEAICNERMISAVPTIISLIVGIGFLTFYFRKYHFEKSLFYSEKKMDSGSFFKILAIFMSIQLIFSILGTGSEFVLNKFGLSILAEIESASNNSKTISMFLYASFLGPIAEEIVFRGFVMRGLQKYGKYFAIFVSAVIFGAFHGNIIQGIFATFVGCILGYVAMEYSIKWSIVLHIINNFVFGDLFNFMISRFNENIQAVMIYSVEGIFFTCSVVIMILNRKKIVEFGKNRNINKRLIWYTFSSVWMIIYLFVQLMTGLSGIQKI